MKRRDLIKRIAGKAKEQQLNWEFVREGASHSLYQLGATRVVLPRHSEINEITALSIMKDLEGQLGKGWWK